MCFQSQDSKINSVRVNVFEITIFKYTCTNDALTPEKRKDHQLADHRKVMVSLLLHDANIRTFESSSVTKCCQLLLRN